MLSNLHRAAKEVFRKARTACITLLLKIKVLCSFLAAAEITVACRTWGDMASTHVSDFLSPLSAPSSPHCSHIGVLLSSDWAKSIPVLGPLPCLFHLLRVLPPHCSPPLAPSRLLHGCHHATHLVLLEWYDLAHNPGRTWSSFSRVKSTPDLDLEIWARPGSVASN